MTNSPAYEAAIEAHIAAFHAFEPIRTAYTALHSKITDAEYLAARKAYDAATKLFDAAFEAEQNA